MKTFINYVEGTGHLIAANPRSAAVVFFIYTVLVAIVF